MERWKGGGIPFGYTYDPANKVLQIDENEGRILATIFDLFLKGLGVNLIANDLNEKRNFGRRTTKWASTTISKMLSPSRLKFYRGFDEHGLAGNWQPILSEENYRLILESREKNKSKNPSKKKAQKEKYLLSDIGILFCGYCGGKVKSSVANSGVYKQFYYYCSSRQSSGRAVCKEAKLVQMKKVEETVKKDLFNKFSVGNLANINYNIASLKKTFISEIANTSQMASQNLIISINGDPESALDNYRNSFNLIEKLWQKYKDLSLPINTTTFSDQELITANIEKITMFNSSLKITYKFPIDHQNNFSVDLEF